MPSEITPEEQARRDVREVSEKRGPEIRAKIALATRPAPEAGSVVEIVRSSLQFAVWAAGEGLVPQESRIAAPEDFLCDYSTETGDEDWDGVPNRVTAAIAEREERIGFLTADFDDCNRERARWKARAERAEKAHDADAKAFLSAYSRAERMKKVLRTIAEGNLGDASWQADYEKIRDIARAALQQEGE